MLDKKTDNTPETLSHNDAAVLKHVDMYQNAIVRFANYSVFCKVLSLVLMTVLLVLLVKENSYHITWVSIFVVFGFYMLESYFLSLEYGFLLSFNQCIRKISEGRFQKSDLFIIRADGTFFQSYLKAMTSISLWPFYMFMFMVVTLVSQVTF